MFSLLSVCCEVGATAATGRTGADDPIEPFNRVTDGTERPVAIEPAEAADAIMFMSEEAAAAAVAKVARGSIESMDDDEEDADEILGTAVGTDATTDGAIEAAAVIPTVDVLLPNRSAGTVTGPSFGPASGSGSSAHICSGGANPGVSTDILKLDEEVRSEDSIDDEEVDVVAVD